MIGSPQQIVRPLQPSSCDADTAVVIVNYRTPDRVTQCLAALAGERPLLSNFRVVVVDGGSGDGSAEQLGSVVSSSEYCDWVSFLPLELNGGFGWANNEAMSRLMRDLRPPKYIHALNPDTEVEPGAVRALVNFLEDHPGFAAVGSQLLEPDGTPAESAFEFTTLRSELSRGARTRAIDRLVRLPPRIRARSAATEIDWTTGASVMFRAESLRRVGLFDEGFFLYHEEVELMWRLRQAGWRIALEPHSRVRHVGGAATGMHGRANNGAIQPRRPKYWFRSRTRYLALTRGRGFAGLAFLAWLVGYLVWLGRRSLRLAPEANPIDHLLRDHLANSFPRKRDADPAIRQWDAVPGAAPAWMQRGSW